jgi:hypothetical protein
MSDLGDTLYCSAKDDKCCGSLTLVRGEPLCSFHRILDEAMGLMCLGDTHDLFESREEALEYIEPSFDRVDPDDNNLGEMDLPRMCSACTNRAWKDD